MFLSGPPEANKKIGPWTKGGTSVKSFFHCGPPFDSKVEIFFSSWRSRPLEHGSTHHMEAWTIKLSHVLSFDRIDFAKIGQCPPTNPLWYVLRWLIIQMKAYAILIKNLTIIIGKRYHGGKVFQKFMCLLSRANIVFSSANILYGLRLSG